jgi:hypothetical protein
VDFDALASRQICFHPLHKLHRRSARFGHAAADDCAREKFHVISTRILLLHIQVHLVYLVGSQERNDQAEAGFESRTIFQLFFVR